MSALANASVYNGTTINKAQWTPQINWVCAQTCSTRFTFDVIGSE